MLDRKQVTFTQTWIRGMTYSVIAEYNWVGLGTIKTESSTGTHDSGGSLYFEPPAEEKANKALYEALCTQAFERMLQFIKDLNDL